MPPSLDVYVVSRRRDRSSVERFLSGRIDRDASEDRGDEELMLLPVGASDAHGDASSWDWEPAVTLTRAIERGVATPARAFAMYLKASDPMLDGVALAFTTDDRVVFGVSIDDPDGQEERLALAKELLEALVEEFDAEAAYIAVEKPAPLLAARIPPAGATRVLYAWSRNAA